MRSWIEFFLDKRFSWDFKIANLIMGGSLRNYLATDILKLRNVADSDACPKLHSDRINRVIDDLNLLMKH